jgi:hypothetical protein
LVIIASLITRRSGTEIRRFVVIPEGETQYSLQFDRLLNEEIARIARGFRTDQLRRIGAAITMSDPTGDRELAGLETKALEAIRQGELKSIIGFWLSEAVRRFQNIGFRPEYVVAGTVVVGTDAATASAQLTRVGRHSMMAILDASSAELVAFEISVPLQSALPATSDTADLTDDPREDARRLANLATVLACKFFISWLEMESTKPARGLRSPETKPASWQTVHDFASALSAIGASR